MKLELMWSYLGLWASRLRRPRSVTALSARCTCRRRRRRRSGKEEVEEDDVDD